MAYKELIVRYNSSRLEVIEVDPDNVLARVIPLAIYIVTEYFFGIPNRLGRFRADLLVLAKQSISYNP